MFFSYIKTAFRNFRKYKGYSFINITGLAVGIACCILILLWVFDELSFDKFHVKADRLYRIVEEQTYAGGNIMKVAVTPAPLAPASLILPGHTPNWEQIRTVCWQRQPFNPTRIRLKNSYSVTAMK